VPGPAPRLALLAAAAVALLGCGDRADRPAPVRGLTYPGPTAAAGPVPVEAPASSTVWSAGDAVLIAWGSGWWRGHVLEVVGPDRYRVHYDGWESIWDEVVPAARLAPQLAEAPPAP